jgi:hypothetical protein
MKKNESINLYQSTLLEFQPATARDAILHRHEKMRLIP